MQLQASGALFSFMLCQEQGAKAEQSCATSTSRCSVSITAVYLVAQHGASVNLSNARGNTALHEAVIGKNEALVDLLLRNGAVTHIRNERNCTPADCAEPVSVASSGLSSVFPQAP